MIVKENYIYQYKEGCLKGCFLVTEIYKSGDELFVSYVTLDGKHNKFYMTLEGFKDKFEMKFVDFINIENIPIG